MSQDLDLATLLSPITRARPLLLPDGSVSTFGDLTAEHHRGFAQAEADWAGEPTTAECQAHRAAAVYLDLMDATTLNEITGP